MLLILSRSLGGFRYDDSRVTALIILNEDVALISIDFSLQSCYDSYCLLELLLKPLVLFEYMALSDSKLLIQLLHLSDMHLLTILSLQSLVCQLLYQQVNLSLLLDDHVRTGVISPLWLSGGSGRPLLRVVSIHNCTIIL